MTDNNDLQIRMESLLAHLQQDIEQINKSLTYQMQRLQEIDQRFTRIERELELLSQPAENRDPRQEKPPHY